MKTKDELDPHNKPVTFAHTLAKFVGVVRTDDRCECPGGNARKSCVGLATVNCEKCDNDTDFKLSPGVQGTRCVPNEAVR